MARTVLICDDALFMRSMLADILKGAGFEVWARRRRVRKR
jgi:chemotaxis response regulator CheB